MNEYCKACNHIHNKLGCPYCECKVSLDRRAPEPIDMIIFCPACDVQHIDAPEPENGWDNPPHTSHLCHACLIVFRLADVPTNGVKTIKTKGSRDTWTWAP